MRSLFLVLLCSSAAHAAPGVVVLWTEPQGTRTQVVEHRGEEQRPLGGFEHTRGAAPKAALIKSGVAVIAQRTDARDSSWASSLGVIDAKGATRWLIDGVAYASRPVVALTGELLVSRGMPGREPDYSKGYGAQLRVDECMVDAIHPVTGERRLLLQRSGYLLHVAGVTDTEALIYVIRPGSTPLVAVDLKTAAVRTVAEHLESARDFSLSATSVIFTERTSEGWRVVRMSLSSPRGQEQLAAASTPELAPFAVAQGPVFINGVTDVFGRRSEPGVELLDLRVSTPEGRFVVGLRRVEAEMPSVVLFDRSRDGTMKVVPPLPGLRPEIAGVRP